jgi:hypothetical protein
LMAARFFQLPSGETLPPKKKVGHTIFIPFFYESITLNFFILKNLNRTFTILIFDW